MKERDNRPHQVTREFAVDHREDLIRGIMERAGPLLAVRRAARAGVLGTMARWRRPILSVSAGLIAAALGAVLLTDDETRWAEPLAETVFPEALVPRPIAVWLSRGEEADVLELIAAVGGYRE